MGNLKEIRTRISSIESTQKITSSMKLVSAAKLRRAQSFIHYLRPYSEKLTEILHNLSAAAESMENMALFEQRAPEKVVIVAITSNKGLCGAFNANICERLTQAFLQHETDKVDIVYNQFLNAATQRITTEDFLPIRNLTTEEESAPAQDYIIEPSPQEVLTELIPKILKNQLYKTLCDSIASEHGARMISMTKATDNATEILRDLRLKYNNARQSSITNELIEIVSGAEALKG